MRAQFPRSSRQCDVLPHVFEIEINVLPDHRQAINQRTHSLLHPDVPALRLVSRMDVGVRAFLDMTDRSSSTPLKGTRICGHPAASKDAGSGTCAAIDWASRETTRRRTGSLCLTARNQVRDHLHVRADGMSRLAIIILRSFRSTGKPTRCRPRHGCPHIGIPRAACLPSIAPSIDAAATHGGWRALKLPPVDRIRGWKSSCRGCPEVCIPQVLPDRNHQNAAIMTSESTQVMRASYFVFHRFPWRSVHSQFTFGSHSARFGSLSVQIWFTTPIPTPKIALMAMVGLEPRFTLELHFR
jgi:hypothetical protein